MKGYGSSTSVPTVVEQFACLKIAKWDASTVFILRAKVVGVILDAILGRTVNRWFAGEMLILRQGINRQLQKRTLNCMAI